MPTAAAGYDPQYAGLDEARLDAYRNLLIDKLDLLNIALNRDDACPIGIVTAEMVEIGDSLSLWDIEPTTTTDGGCIRIRVSAGGSMFNGGEANAPDFESLLSMGVQNNVGFKYSFQTHITVYLHPDALTDLARSSVQQAAARERTMARICDWITLGVCNNWNPDTQTGGLVVPLQSHVLTCAPDIDYLLDSHVARGYRDWQFRGLGRTEAVPALHLVIQSTIE